MKDGRTGPNGRAHKTAPSFSHQPHYNALPVPRWKDRFPQRTLHKLLLKAHHAFVSLRLGHDIAHAGSQTSLTTRGEQTSSMLKRRYVLEMVVKASISGLRSWIVGWSRRYWIPIVRNHIYSLMNALDTSREDLKASADKRELSYWEGLLEEVDPVFRELLKRGVCDCYAAHKTTSRVPRPLQRHQYYC